MGDFLLDLRRLFSKRISANLRNLILENFLQPLVVALFVLFAFVNRSSYIDHRETLVYFSTLYAFWIGLFGSCQSVNTELRNGEWSYWVLGMGRSKWTHLAAIYTANFIFAANQLVVFLLTIFCFRFFVSIDYIGIGSVYSNFISDFCSVKDSGSPLFQMQGMLRVLLDAWLPNMGADCFVFCLFGLSLLMATFSGIGFGVLFSSVFKDPIVSLNISVGFVVVLGMISFKGLDGGSNDREKEELDSNFGATIMALSRSANAELDSESSHIHPLISVSRFLPQRYFYNIGTMTFRRPVYKWKNDDGTESNEVADFVAKFGENGPKPEWLEFAVEDRKKSVIADDARRLYCVTNSASFEKLQDVRSILCLNEERMFLALTSSIIRDAASTDTDYFRRVGLIAVLRLLAIAALVECACITMLFAMCALFTICAIKTKEVFHALR